MLAQNPGGSHLKDIENFSTISKAWPAWYNRKPERPKMKTNNTSVPLPSTQPVQMLKGDSGCGECEWTHQINSLEKKRCVPESVAVTTGQGTPAPDCNNMSCIQPPPTAQYNIQHAEKTKETDNITRTSAKQLGQGIAVHSREKSGLLQQNCWWNQKRRENLLFLSHCEYYLGSSRSWFWSKNRRTLSNKSKFEKMQMQHVSLLRRTIPNHTPQK